MRLCLCCVLLIYVQCLYAADKLLEDLTQLQVVLDKDKVSTSSSGLPEYVRLTLSFDSPLYPVSAVRLVSLDVAQSFAQENLLPKESKNSRSIKYLSSSVLDITINKSQMDKPVLSQCKGVVEVTFPRQHYITPIEFTSKDAGQVLGLPVDPQSMFVFEWEPTYQQMIIEFHKYFENVLYQGAETLNNKGEIVHGKLRGYQFPRCSLKRVEPGKKESARLHWHGDLMRVQYEFEFKDIGMVYQRTGAHCGSVRLPVVIGTGDKRLKSRVLRAQKKLKPKKMRMEPYFKSMEKRLEELDLVEDADFYLADWNQPGQAKHSFDVFDQISVVTRAREPDPAVEYYYGYRLHPLTQVNGERIESWALSNLIDYYQRAMFDADSENAYYIINMGNGTFSVFDRTVGKHTLLPIVSDSSNNKIMRFPEINYEITTTPESEAAYKQLKKTGALAFFQDYYVARRGAEYDKKIRYYDDLEEILIKHPLKNLHVAFLDRLNYLLFRQYWLNAPEKVNRQMNGILLYHDEDVVRLLQIAAKIDHQRLREGLAEKFRDFRSYGDTNDFGNRTGTAYFQWVEAELNKALKEHNERIKNKVDVFGQKVNE